MLLLITCILAIGFISWDSITTHIKHNSYKRELDLLNINDRFLLLNVTYTVTGIEYDNKNWKHSYIHAKSQFEKTPRAYPVLLFFDMFGENKMK